MKILAVSVKGREFAYNPKTAHKVNANKANEIAAILNRISWNIKDGETWYAHDVDKYDTAFVYAEYQSFVYGKNGLRERRA